MTTYAEGDTVALAGERGKRYKVERIKLNGEVDLRGPRGLRTVTSDRIVPKLGEVADAAPSHAAPKRRDKK